MSTQNYHELAKHIGHKIVCVSYGQRENVAIECMECSEVLLDFDRLEPYATNGVRIEALP